jgi:hypothetical protein
LEIYVISCLACGIEPRTPIPEEVWPLHRFIKDAVEDGELPARRRDGEVNALATISRQDLRQFAEGKKNLPAGRKILTVCDDWDERHPAADDSAEAPGTEGASLSDRSEAWNTMLMDLVRSERISRSEAARRIAKTEGVAPETVERETRRLRAGKAGTKDA